MVQKLLPAHQGKLLAISAGLWFLNTVSCMVWSEALKEWYGSMLAKRQRQDRHSQISSSCNSIHRDKHIQWSTRRSLKRNKKPGHRLIYTWGPTYSVRRVLAASYANFSGEIRDRDWRRLVPIESSRGRSLCEIELLCFDQLVSKYNKPREDLWKFVQVMSCITTADRKKNLAFVFCI